ncbi:short-chain dehydrogenase [Microthyrium microscopicum]|uniref:Short-chain dehydrogenase n=1 Tax=Microthyrium microscopicum TaxID=703497 RepID=A0A6A6UBH3_9PEZI|nr:short-chain dehydrogenase [Microthyrium microscopicum]
MSTFTATTTAAEVAAAYPSAITNKVILTTGVSPNSLGATFVQTLAAHSPKLLILAGRNVSKLRATQAAIETAYPSTPTRLLTLDLSSQSGVRTAAKEVLSYKEPIDILVNNAAIMASPFALTPDNLESQFGTNHIGHFLFTALILPRMLTANGVPRIINISSAGHRLSRIRFDDVNFKTGYNKWAAYGQAKTANMLFSVELARRYGDRVLSYSVHPGMIWTNLGTHLTQEDFDSQKVLDAALGNTLEEGAATHMFAMCADLEAVNGAYLLDCRVARPEEVRSGAGDGEEARKLWSLSEEIVGQKFD